MYKKILTPIDNSDDSRAAIQASATIAQALGSTVVGFHVYAAGLHENRFRQMESGLPEKYQQPEELQHQRTIHETLISEGLRIISESYLDYAEEICREVEVPYERRLAEGRNYVEVLREIEGDGYDLAALGALGLGAGSLSLIGGVCERVLRRSPIDVLVVRKSLPDNQGVMVAIDGSPGSFKAVDTALLLGKALKQPVEIVSVFDPEFHIVAFRSIADVISEEAGALFRFEEQQKLHEEIIDKGLEKLYRGHLETATRLAKKIGQTVETTLLTGKPFQRVLEYIDERRPSLLVVGRFGLHRTEYADIGNTSENLTRLAPCSVVVVSGELDPEQEQPSTAQSTPEIPWTDEAEARFQKVPSFARGMARQAIEEYALSHNYPQVTPDVIADARTEMGM